RDVVNITMIIISSSHGVRVPLQNENDIDIGWVACKLDVGILAQSVLIIFNFHDFADNEPFRKVADKTARKYCVTGFHRGIILYIIYDKQSPFTVIVIDCPVRSEEHTS